MIVSDILTSTENLYIARYKGVFLRSSHICSRVLLYKQLLNKSVSDHMHWSAVVSS